jgi:hypothetical protein
VTNITSNEGELVFTNKPILSIIPEEANLYAELYVPSRSIGFLEVGQIVRMRLDAFPVSKYGDIEGEVYEINRILSMPSEWSNPLNIQNPIYRVKVSLNEQYIKVFEERIPLQSGLHLDADIVLESQTIYQTLISPIIELNKSIH